MVSIQMEQQKLQYLLKRWGRVEFTFLCTKVLIRLLLNVVELILFVRHRRTHIPNLPENCNSGDRLFEQCGKMNQQLRAPFTVLIQNFHNVDNLPDQHNVSSTKEVPGNGKSLQIKICLKTHQIAITMPEKHIAWNVWENKFFFLI